ncbi:MAG: alpha-amylase [Bacteroidales bacterium]|nr:alpha-amylase [Bacteroidales bacterium]
MDRKFIFYQMLPRLLGSRNWVPGGTLEKNGCGKLKDITTDYLLDLKQNLHVDAVWYTGVIAHATKARFEGVEPCHPDLVKGQAGSPYAITDYFEVAPYLADSPAEAMHDFEALVSRTHKAGMKVIIDFVPNHVFRQFRPPFTKNNFYTLYGQSLKLPFETTYSESPALGTGNCPGNAEPSKYDWYDTVKLNYDYKYTWNIMLDVLQFWAGKGVDGFRCDMVELVPADFFRWAIAQVRHKFPGTLFIAEAYDKGNYHRYHDAGFDYLYDKSGFYDALREVCAGHRPAYWLTGEWQFLGDLQPRMLNFLENHDEVRLASDFFLGNGRKGLAPLAVSMLFNTAPFMIYFGQEYGERGMLEEGYSGRDGRTSIYDWCCLETADPAQRDLELYERYKQLTALAADPVFSEGKSYDLMYLNPSGEHFDASRQFAFMRSWGGRGALVVANFADIAVDVRLNIPQDVFGYLEIPMDNRFFDTISIPAHDAVIIKTFNE